MPTRPTQALAEFAAGLRWQDIPAPVVHQGKRAFLNILATSFAGCREPAVETALAVMTPFSGPATCSLVGRGGKRDAALSACINAMAANIHDYDYTHPATIIHPTAPVAPALFALSDTRPCSGEGLLRAFLIGAEITCRIGDAVSPGHYARGWHITATCGVFGAAAGSAALLGLGPRGVEAALANAAVQASGMVEALGTMSKSLGVGNAARGGLIAALLAERGFDGPAEMLTGPRGYLGLSTDTPDPEALTSGLGRDWSFATNTYKPYPVGVVLNPVIDAALEIAARPGFRADRVDAVELTGHPLLRTRADRPDVATGRESQVSAQHAIAIAWARGQAGLDEFTDAAVALTRAEGRPQVRFTDDRACDPASVAMTVRMRDETVLTARIEAARGTGRNPLTDADLERKLASLAAHSGFSGDVAALAQACWSLDRAPDAGAFVRLAASG